MSKYYLVYTIIFVQSNMFRNINVIFHKIKASSKAVKILTSCISYSTL